MNFLAIRTSVFEETRSMIPTVIILKEKVMVCKNQKKILFYNYLPKRKTSNLNHKKSILYHLNIIDSEHEYNNGIEDENE